MLGVRHSVTADIRDTVWQLAFSQSFQKNYSINQNDLDILQNPAQLHVQ